MYIRNAVYACCLALFVASTVIKSVGVCEGIRTFSRPCTVDLPPSCFVSRSMPCTTNPSASTGTSSVIGGILSKSWAPKDRHSYCSGGEGGVTPLASVAKIYSMNKRRMPVLSPSSAALHRKEEGMGIAQNQSMGSLGWVLSCVSGDPWDGGGGRAGRRRVSLQAVVSSEENISVSRAVGAVAV